jgi:prefoldin subunit 5
MDAIDLEQAVKMLCLELSMIRKELEKLRSEVSKLNEDKLELRYKGDTLD